MKRCFGGLLIAALMLAVASPAFAQGGGASSTGTIQGRVTDAQGAVLPGVTMTATSSVAARQQTAVTSETGNYRFPAVPPGTYTLTYELAGFNRSSVRAFRSRLGFTANVNVELALATLQETVTVTGESPVIDTSATRIQQNFKLEQLQSIPNGRDMWALLAVTPSVQMGRIDVGGNRAGTQTGYTAYGFNGQVRVLIEGINTTEGTGGAGFYFDYASLEEAFLGTSGPVGRDAEPGCAEPVHRQVGRQPVLRRVLPRLVQQLAAGLEHSRRVHGADRLQRQPAAIRPAQQRDRPLLRHGDQRRRTDQARQDLVVRHLPQAVQRGRAAELPVRQDLQHQALESGSQGHLSGQPEPQDHRLLPVGTEDPAEPAAVAPTYTYLIRRQTFVQDSGSWVYKAEWNGTLSDKLYVEARYGDFGYYFPLITNSTATTSGATRASSILEAHISARTIATASSGPAQPPTSSTRRGQPHA